MTKEALVGSESVEEDLTTNGGGSFQRRVTDPRDIPERLYELLDILLAMRLDLRGELDGQVASTRLNPAKIQGARSLLDQAIASTKDTIEALAAPTR
jgi:hypothetical protein